MSYKAAFDHKRKFGVEIEFFGVNQFEVQHAFQEAGIKSKIGLCETPSEEFWYITDDGSIEGPDPIELKSPVLVGMDGLLEVKRVLTLLNYLECQTNDSCGFHVHHNSEDYTGKNVLSLLRLYAKFEQVIDLVVAPSRRGDQNRHCRSLVKDGTLEWVQNLDKKETALALEIALRFDKDYKVKSIGSIDALGSRNHKINIVSYLKHGTIEFRHHEGTIDIDEAVNWIVFTQQLINRAKLASVSREMSARPVLGELIRVLALASYQESQDPLVIQTKEWLKNKFSRIRRDKPVTSVRTAELSLLPNA